MDAARLRADVRAAVAALHCGDARTAVARERFLEEFDRLERPFDEHGGPVHVTASAIVAGSRGTVLHRHKRLGLWLQPGGHVDPGESPWTAAVRETLEETGLSASHPRGRPHLVHVDVHPGGRGHTHLDLRYLLHAEGDLSPAGGESQAVAWFGWREALELADDALVGALRACTPGLVEGPGGE